MLEDPGGKAGNVSRPSTLGLQNIAYCYCAWLLPTAVVAAPGAEPGFRDVSSRAEQWLIGG